MGIFSKLFKGKNTDGEDDIRISGIDNVEDDNGGYVGISDSDLNWDTNNNDDIDSAFGIDEPEREQIGKKGKKRPIRDKKGKKKREVEEEEDIYSDERYENYNNKREELTTVQRDESDYDDYDDYDFNLNTDEEVGIDGGYGLSHGEHNLDTYSKSREQELKEASETLTSDDYDFLNDLLTNNEDLTIEEILGLIEEDGRNVLAYASLLGEEEVQNYYNRKENPAVYGEEDLSYEEEVKRELEEQKRLLEEEQHKKNYDLYQKDKDLKLDEYLLEDDTQKGIDTELLVDEELANLVETVDIEEDEDVDFDSLYGGKESSDKEVIKEEVNENKIEEAMEEEEEEDEDLESLLNMNFFDMTDDEEVEEEEEVEEVVEPISGLGDDASESSKKEDDDDDDWLSKIVTGTPNEEEEEIDEYSDNVYDDDDLNNILSKITDGVDDQEVEEVEDKVEDKVEESKEEHQEVEEQQEDILGLSGLLEDNIDEIVEYKDDDVHEEEVSKQSEESDDVNNIISSLDIESLLGGLTTDTDVPEEGVEESDVKDSNEEDKKALNLDKENNSINKQETGSIFGNVTIESLLGDIDNLDKEPGEIDKVDVKGAEVVKAEVKEDIVIPEPMNLTSLSDTVTEDTEPVIKEEVAEDIEEDVYEEEVYEEKEEEIIIPKEIIVDLDDEDNIIKPAGDLEKVIKRDKAKQLPRYERERNFRNVFVISDAIDKLPTIHGYKLYKVNNLGDLLYYASKKDNLLVVTNDVPEDLLDDFVEWAESIMEQDVEEYRVVTLKGSEVDFDLIQSTVYLTESSLNNYYETFSDLYDARDSTIGGDFSGGLYNLLR